MMEYVANQKLSISLSEIHDEITHKGWEVTKVKYDKKDDRYIANAKHNEFDQEVEAFGKNEKQALANLLNNVAYEHAKGIQRLARWKTTFEGQLPQIAEAYSKAAAYEKKAAAAFMELAAECSARAETIKKHLQVTVTNNPEPYTFPDKMYDDVRKRRKLEVSMVAADNHPIWTRAQVVDYRICLDVLGFTAADADWGWEGTNHAFAAFAALLPELAQEALFSELVGQTAYATYYRAYGPAKICLLTKLIEKAMKEENPHKGFRGIHPSQMLMPSETPEAKQITAKKTKPNDDGTIPFDINDGWSSTLENIPTIHYPTECHDFLNLRGASDVLDGLHTDWSEAVHDSSDDSHVRHEWRTYKTDDPDGALRIQHAVANAIKAALLLEDNTLGHGAVQYQALLHMVSDDPEDLLKTLHSARSEWNVERFGDHTSEEHRPWANHDLKSGQIPMLALASMIYAKDKDKSPTDAHLDAQRKIHEMLSRFHEQAKGEAKTDNMPKDEAGWQSEQEAIEKVMKWVSLVTDGSGKFDHYQLPGQHVAADVDPIKPHKYGDDPEMQENHKVFNLQRFPAVHTKNVQTIAKLIKHLDQIVEEALVDVHSHDGKGHHFRAYIMHLADIDPKTVGVMWLLLAPYTSELSMIDEEMAGALGHHADGKAPRDYFLHERELIGHRDGMGLSHIPLGHFNVALKGGHVADGSKQSAKGPKHQDLSFLRIDNPTPAWKVKLNPDTGLKYKFELTPEIFGPIQDHWNRTVATQFAPDETPTKKQRPAFMPIARVSSKMQEYRNLGLSVEDVWNQFDEPLAKQSAQPGWTDFYHATPRSNRESIQNLGLMGENGTSPWGDPWKRGQPEGNYFFNNPEDAIQYAEDRGRPVKKNYPDYEDDRWIYPEQPEDFDDWTDQQQDDWHEQNPEAESDDDPDGWDVWKVNTRGLPIHRDPENQIAQQNHDIVPNPADVFRKQKWMIEPDWEDRVADDADYRGMVPARFYTQDHVTPDRVQLHQHIPRWNIRDFDDDDRREHEDNTHIPQVWDQALEHRPTFPAHSSVIELEDDASN